MEQPPLPLSGAFPVNAVPQSSTGPSEPVSNQTQPNAYERMETFLAEREQLDYLPKLSQQKEKAAPT